MGSWRSYLERLADAACERARGERSADRLRAAFERALADALSVSELLQRSRLEAAAREGLRPQTPTRSEPVLTDARAYLRYRFSADEGLVALFWRALDDLGDEARRARAPWDELVRSLEPEPDDGDGSVAAFYGHVCRDYFARHGDELRKRAREARTVSEQRALLRDVLRGVIESDGVFRAGFEEERKARMDFVGRECNVREQIRAALTGESVKVYLRLAFALDAPRRSIVLTDTGTALKRELSKTLPDINDSPSAALDGKYYYYNTGGGAAETLRIIAVSSAQLL